MVKLFSVAEAIRVRFPVDAQWRERGLQKNFFEHTIMSMQDSRAFSKRFTVLNFFVALWSLVTAFYICAAVAFFEPFAGGIVVITVARFTGFTIPEALFQRSNLGSPYFGLSWNFFMVVNLIGVVLSVIALINVRKQWQWSLVFVGLSFLSWWLTISNASLSFSNSPFSSGGIMSGYFATNDLGMTMANAANSAVVFIIAMGILILSKKRQTGAPSLK